MCRYPVSGRKVGASATAFGKPADDRTVFCGSCGPAPHPVRGEPPMRMRINTLLDTAKIPNNGGELRFFQRDDEYTIEVVGIGGGLMTTAVHG